VLANNGPRPAVLRDMKVWISADGGEHWTRAVVSRGEDGAHRASVVNPRAAGPVTIRTEATDRDGNSVQQTIADAYLVK
jgi:hypothetical protein